MYVCVCVCVCVWRRGGFTTFKSSFCHTCTMDCIVYRRLFDHILITFFIEDCTPYKSIGKDSKGKKPKNELIPSRRHHPIIIIIRLPRFSVYNHYDDVHETMGQTSSTPSNTTSPTLLIRKTFPQPP